MSKDGSICGGVMSESEMKAGRKKDIYFGMMSSTLPDNKIKEYRKLKNAWKHDEASKLFEKYGFSGI